MSEDPQTRQLKRTQQQREAAEEHLTETAPDEHEAEQHARRAEKARYLKKKLEDRAEAERES